MPQVLVDALLAAGMISDRDDARVANCTAQELAQLIADGAFGPVPPKALANPTLAAGIQLWLI